VRHGVVRQSLSDRRHAPGQRLEPGGVRKIEVHRVPDVHNRMPVRQRRLRWLTESIIKCDTCGGDPACVQYCPNNALEYVDDNISTRSRKKVFASKFKDAFQEV
jgi:Fe-S-cluster-containing hydrogenase component 2